MRTRNYYIGAALWLSSIQYYVAQLIVAGRWQDTQPYSWATNTISDLANTHCGLYGERLVCSPLSMVMNVSFIVLGIAQAVGALLLWNYLGVNQLAKLGLAGLMLAGVGTVLVGLFPENTVSALHITGAALPFVFGNLAMVLIGFAAHKLPPALRVFTVLCGLVGLSALALFMTQTYLGLGIGGMERVVAYPQSIWMIASGLYLVFLQKPE